MTGKLKVSAQLDQTLGILSIRDLAFRLGMRPAELNRLAGEAGAYYRPFELRKKPRIFQPGRLAGKIRHIDNPLEPLKGVQKKIQETLLAGIPLPSHVMGGVRGRSTPQNISQHAGPRVLVTVDIKDYFPSITTFHVFGVWRALGCSTKVSQILTKLTTFRRHLPQGSPTSTTLANLVQLAFFDRQVAKSCAAAGCRHTSWIDDLAISGADPRAAAGPVIAAIRAAGFRVSRKKIAVMGPGDRKELNGLIAGPVPTVKRSYRNYLRRGIFECGRIEPNQRAHAAHRLAGSIAYVASISPTHGKRLHADLRATLAKSE